MMMPTKVDTSKYTLTPSLTYIVSMKHLWNAFSYDRELWEVIELYIGAIDAAIGFI